MKARSSIGAENLGFRYPRRWGRKSDGWALRDCSFEIPEGSLTALVGMNGAGKTTLMSIMADIYAPTTGKVFVGGTPSGAAPSGGVALVAQDKPLYRNFTVRDMLHVVRNMNDTWDQERARRWLASFDIPLDRTCGELSGGQQAQVALALALGRVPSVLLLDEPLANLDPVARREVVDALLNDVRESRMTVLFSTHVVAELDDVVDHLLLIKQGRVVLNGGAEELRAGHVHVSGPVAQRHASEVVYTSRRRAEGREWSLLRRSSADHAAPVSGSSRRPSLEEVVVGYLDSTTQADGLAEVNR